jgi:hypothetical protein
VSRYICLCESLILILTIIVELSCCLETYDKGVAGNPIGEYVLDANDNMAAAVTFASGVIGTIHCTRWVPAYVNRKPIRVYDNKGSIEVDLSRSATACYLYTVATTAYQTVEAAPTPSFGRLGQSSVQESTGRRPMSLSTDLRWAGWGSRLFLLSQAAPERVRHVQEHRLRRILRHAANASPFYRERFAGIDLDHCELADLPVEPLPGALPNLDRVRQRLDEQLGLTGFANELSIELEVASRLEADPWTGKFRRIVSQVGEPMDLAHSTSHLRFKD